MKSYQNISNQLVSCYKFLVFSLIVLLFSSEIVAQKVDNTDFINQMNNYNVVWDSQSKNSSESMPLGGGDIGLNVWVENAQLLFYISRSGTFDENNQFLKLGRGRIKLEPNIFADPDTEFRQELKLYDGYVQITGKKGSKKTTINLWVDVHKPVININVESDEKVTAKAYYENWRNSPRKLSMIEKNSCFSYSGYPGDVFTYTDSIAYDNNSVLWYHRNRDDKLLFDFSVNQQGLNSVKDKLLNTQKGLTFGGYMLGKNMKPSEQGEGKYVDTPFKYWSITSKKPKKNHQIKMILHTAQTKTLDDWKQQLHTVKSSFNDKKAWNKTKDWWHKFWNRSHIFINKESNDKTDKGWQVGRNYQLFRYQLACNAYGEYPTKFNGGLFTADPRFVRQTKEIYTGTPDYRSWGGGSHTAQNQRLVYWPMLKTGDFDMMPSQFDFYARSLKNAEIRTQVYWNHEGCSFTEHPETFALPAAGTWGFDSGIRKRSDTIPHGTLTNKWVRLHYTNQLEFSFMILKYYEYSKRDISKYIPFINSSLTFFFEHYKYLELQRTGKPFDENNKLVIYPSTAAETFKNVKNPTDIVVALKAVIEQLQNLPDEFISKEKKNFWKGQLVHIPEMSYSIKDGKKIIVAAKKLPKSINADLPEMYAVFPYAKFGIGHPNLEVAVNTWKSGILDSRKNYISWHQDAIFAAKMGLIEEAKKVTIQKLQDSPRRFPTFWGPGHDYVPDHNWGGSGMIGLQDMLVQYKDDQIFLLPSWPKDWNVDFKVKAPNNTTIEGETNNGKLENVSATPSIKTKNIINYWKK